MAERFTLNVDIDVYLMAVVVEQARFKSFTKWPLIANTVEEVMRGFTKGEPLSIFSKIRHNDGSGRWEGCLNEGINLSGAGARVADVLRVALEPHGVDVVNEHPEPKPKPKRKARAKRPKLKPTPEEQSAAYLQWSASAERIRGLKLQLQEEQSKEQKLRTELHRVHNRLGIKLGDAGTV